MTDYISEYYAPFGVAPFHAAGIFGEILLGPATGTKIKFYMIDTGFDDQDPDTPGIQVNVDLSNVIVRNFSNEAGSREVPSHGSLTSALVAAPLNNFGILGVCPDATVLLGDVDNADENLYQTNVVAALNDAIAEGVDIICLPLGSTTFIPALETAISNAVAAGIYVFASAGNSGLQRYEYPASFPGVISVGSVNLDKQLSTFNTKNEKISIFAPGESYLLPSSVGPVLATGTSYSAPFAAGLAALHLCKERETDPDYKPTTAQLIQILRSPDYLDNGTLGYAAITAPTEISTSTLQQIGMVVGGFLLLGIIILIFINIRSSAARKREQKALERAEECALSGEC
jgi:major intracellular serine protease